MTIKTVTMTIKESTRGVHVYECDPDNSAGISIVYLSRSSLPKTPPPTIKVTIEHE